MAWAEFLEGDGVGGSVSDSPSAWATWLLLEYLPLTLGSNPWIYSLSQVATALPECLFHLFHVQRGKLSPGNKLPGVTESRDWQGLASGLAAIPFVIVRIGVRLDKDRHTVCFPERQCARLAETSIVWVGMDF